MKSLFFIIAIALLINSCSDDPNKPELVNGTYTGIFHRSSPNAKYGASDIVITFNKQTFEGSSSITRYPVICDGTYTISGNEIEFFNSCALSGKFDYSFILSGKYELTIEGNEILMTNAFEKTYDKYRLIRK